MSAERDELATIIGEQFEHGVAPNCPVCADVDRAAAAVEVMGYRKPRTITTVAELDALPDNSVVLDEMDGPLIKVGSWFHSPTDEMKAHSVIFPAILLYEP